MSTPVSSVDAPSGSASRVNPAPRLFLIASVALIVLIAAMRAWVSWGSDAWINHPAGVLIAMAADLKNGIFYRPLYSAVGYGGTRYFPLYFVLHAGLMKLGIPVLLGAYLLSAASVAALLAGVFYLLRALGVEPWLAACSAASVLAAGCAQYSLLSPHADGMASALNVWGLAVSARPNPSYRKVLLASLLFTLAWSAKVTTVFGVAATFVWFLAAGIPQMAWALAAATGCGYLLVGGAMVLASQGRIVEIFKACATGGTNLLGIAAGPWNMLVQAARLDPAVLLFALLAMLALAHVVSTTSFSQNLPALFLVAALVVTAVIYGSPGLNENHLLDVQVASVVLIAFCVAHAEVPLYKQLGTSVLALAILAATLPLLRQFKNRDLRFHRHRFQTVLDLVGDSGKPILAENPVVPVLAGQQSYVLDPWMLRLLRTRTPGFGDPLLEGLRHRTFGAVVLCMADPKTNFGRWWFETTHFGPGFASALNENYRLVKTVDDQKIYLPVEDGSGLAAAPPGGQ
jgi:hypothetical protein